MLRLRFGKGWLRLLKARSDPTEVTETDLAQIRTSLREDSYRDDEIDEMLAASTLLKDAAGVTVTYDNGVQDRFEYKPVLLHLACWTENRRD